MFEQIPYKRPLIIPTGGGNDIVSGTLVLYEFIRSGKNPDLAGMCSPGASHTYDGHEEEPVNVVNSNTKRYISSKTRKEIPFIDSLIPGILKREGINTEVYNLSCKHGTKKLIVGLNQLIKKNGYDGIVAVDVGGDVLARGAKDPTILSPLMDFTALYVASQLNLPSTLIEFGLQTDGELRPQGCAEILSELKTDGSLRGIEVIKATDDSVNFFKKTYQEIEKVRHGHTAHMTLQTLESPEDIHTEYRTKIQVLDKKWPFSFPITLESKYFGKAFIIDLKDLAKTRELAFSYETLPELYLKSKKIVDTKNEMDMLYTWQDNSCIWLGLLCPQIKGEQRKEILNYGLDNLEGHADVALLWQKDAVNLARRKHTKEVSDFVLTGDSLDHVEKVVLSLEKILGAKN